ncbi:MAG: 23S rRNA pseudouridine(2604) synthase RluF [Rikenellaceae bacterium]
MEIRLNKFINDSGYCSRREADRYIESNNVTVNGKVATLGTKVKPTDKVRVNGLLIESQTEYVYLALNKPVGISSTTDTTDKTNVVDFINYPTRIFHIGRLDKDSEGLLLLTNDGDIVNKILRAGNSHQKEYEVWVDKPIEPSFIERMSGGVKILGTVTKKCKVEQEGTKKFRITLTQGLNRQIRRMCSALGYEVTRLKRVRIMNITLASLPTGHWRELTKPELDTLLSSIKDSDGTEQASKGAGAGKQPAKKTSPNKPTKPTKAAAGGGYEGRSGSRPSASGKKSSTRQSNNKPHKSSHSGRSAHKSSNRRG